MGVKPAGPGISSPGQFNAAIQEQIPGKLQEMQQERSQALALAQALSATEARPTFGGGEASEAATLAARVDRLEQQLDRLLSGAE
jgi:hypothetical protein